MNPPTAIAAARKPVASAERSRKTPATGVDVIMSPSLPSRYAHVVRKSEQLGVNNVLGVRTQDVEIAVRLKPRGSRDELLGMRDGVLEAKVTAPPVDGRANKALCKLVAKRVGVAPSRVSVVRGPKSREKVVRVEGVDRDAVETALEGL